MAVVYKYVLSAVDYPSVEMKKNAVLLHTAVQGGVLCVWARVDPSEGECVRRFRLAGTGHELKPGHAGRCFSKHKQVWFTPNESEREI